MSTHSRMSPYFCFKMRKYKQLILILLTVTSFLLFLVYRYQYKKLHYVLEVLNFFGQPCNLSEVLNVDHVAQEHNWGPNPVWQEDIAGIKVYSSFLTGVTEVYSIVLVPNLMVKPKRCYLWQDAVPKKYVGKLETAVLNVNTQKNVSVNAFKCKVAAKLPDLYAVSYVAGKDLYFPVNTEVTTNHNFNFTVCLFETDGMPFTKHLVSEFISFHSLIGVDSFIIYSKNLPFKFIKFLRNFAVQLKLSLIFFDNTLQLSDELMRTVVEQDCFYRTRNQSMYSTAMAVNEYITPVSSNHLFNLIYSDHPERIPVQYFCLPPNNTSEEPLILQTYSMLMTSQEDALKMHIINKNFVDKNSGIYNPNSIALNRYIHCNPNKPQRYENLVQRFVTDFKRSTLIQLLTHKSL